MPWSRTRLAETSSWVESGFEAQSTTSAPPSRRQMARFAVSAVTCRHAEMRMPLRGWFLMNSLRIICSTFMDWFAHSMRFLPSSASSRLLMSLLICAADDIRLLWRFTAENFVWLPGLPVSISSFDCLMLFQNTRIGGKVSMPKYSSGSGTFGLSRRLNFGQPPLANAMLSPAQNHCHPEAERGILVLA